MWNHAITRSIALLAFSAIACACGPQQEIVAVEIVSVVDATRLRCPGDVSASSERTENALLFWSTSDPAEIVCTAPVRGNLEVTSPEKEYPPPGEEGGIYEVQRNETCDDTCLCPQPAKLPWWERDYLVVGTEFTAVLVDRDGEPVPTVVVEVCLTETSSTW